MKLDPSMLGVSEYDRAERDFYPTPRTATLAVFDHLLLCHDDIVWEPACGDGAMSKVLAEKVKTVVNTDIHPLMDDAVEADFYTYNPDFAFDWIITNPPYGLEADKFIERILYFCQNPGKYGAILARNELDSAKGRARFFKDCPNFMEKRSLLWRPRWVAGSTGSPRHNYSWYFWGPDQYEAKITYSLEKK